MSLNSIIGQFFQSKVVILLLTLITIFVVKDLISIFASNLSSALLFFFDKNFNEGDEIVFNSKNVRIIKIGLMTTILESKDTGNWLYISNKKMKGFILEKKKK